MAIVEKTVIVPYPQNMMFELVSDFKNYPKYLPWCSNSSIIKEEVNHIIGRVDIDYLKIKTHFTTKNTNTPYNKIEITLVDGPFSNLVGFWQFIPLGNNGTKIEFYLKYQFSSTIFEKIIGPVFSFISKNIVDCFVKEAHRLYHEHNNVKS